MVRSRFKIGGEGGLVEIPPEQSDEEREEAALRRDLEEVNKELKTPGLKAEKEIELWRRKRRLEKELGLDKDESGENPTGVYL